MLREVPISISSIFLDYNFNGNSRDKFLHNCRKITIFDEDSCPRCGKGFDMVRTPHHDFFDIFDERQYSFNLISVYQCPCCHKGFVVMHHIERQETPMCGNVFAETSQSVYPSVSTNLQIDKDIQKVSPRFYEIYSQCLQAKASELNELYGMGFRKALEHLVKDYAIFKNPEERKKIESMKLHNCIEEYFNDSDAKNALMACKILGNNETHFVNDNDENDIHLFEDLIEDTIYYIHREFRNEKATQIIDANKNKKSR